MPDSAGFPEARAGVSVEASWHVECSACGGLMTASRDRPTALAEANAHIQEHRRNGDSARRFTGKDAWNNAANWAAEPEAGSDPR